MYINGRFWEFMGDRRAGIRFDMTIKWSGIGTGVLAGHSAQLMTQVTTRQRQLSIMDTAEHHWAC